jgi:hypothetical protein
MTGSDEVAVLVGVPQGSLISLLLLCFFIVPLYNRLRAVPGLMTVGLTDDTNLLACGTETAQCVATLKEGWAVYKTWAMTFEPAKSSLVHFCHARAGRSETARLGCDMATPQESARFPKVTLDRKLRFATHKKHVISRLHTQKFTLSYIVIKTWGLL